MKKFLSLTLSLLVLMIACLSLASCGNTIDENTVKKDPQTAIMNAITNTSQAFYTDDAEINPIIAKALTGGSINVSFETQSLLGDLTKISETLYMSEKEQRVVSDTLVTYSGKNYTGRLFLDENGVILSSETLLGSKKSLSLNLDSFFDRFADSELAAAIGMNTSEVREALAEMKAMFDNTETETEMKAKLYEILAVLGQTVASGKTENQNGDAVDCVTVTYTLTNESLEALCDKIVELYAETGENADDLALQLESAIAELNEMLTLDLDCILYIEMATGKLIKTEVSMDAQSLDSAADSIAADIVILCSDTEISLDAKLFEGGKSIGGANVTLKKTVEDTLYTYALTVNVTEDGKTEKLTDAAYTYDKKSGDIRITADIYSDGEKVSFAVGGKILASKDTATIELNSITYGDFTVNFKLSFSFTANAEIPAVPTDAKDIVTLTSEELEIIMTEIQTSDLVKLIEGLG